MDSPLNQSKTVSSTALAIAAATTGVLPVFLTGALSVQLGAGLHIKATDIGIGVAAFFASSALCSVTAGRLAERVGALKMMRFAALVAMISMTGLGLLTHALWNLAALLALGGVSNGAMQPAANLYLSKNVHTQRQGLAFGIKQAGIPAATLLSGVAVPTLALTEGWRSAYLAGAGFATCVVVLLLTLIRDDLNAPTSSVRCDPYLRGSTHRVPSIHLPPLVLLASGMACAVAAANSLGSFVVPSLVYHGVHPGDAGILSAIGSVVGFSARVGQGWRADTGVNKGIPAALRHLATVVVMISIGILGYLALASGISELLVPGVILAYGAGWGFNGLFNLAVVRAYPFAPARATGITQVGTYLGGMLGPLGFGLFVDHLGYGPAWSMCAVLAGIGAITLFAARRLLGRGPAASLESFELPEPIPHL